MPLLFLAFMLSVGTLQKDDLAIRIARVETRATQADDLEFVITLENRGDRDFVVFLGSMLGNGKTMLPTAVSLTLTDASGRTRKLRYRMPGVVGGTVEDYVVPLRHRAAHVLRVSLDEYDGLGGLAESLRTGAYSLQAALEAATPQNVASMADRREKLPPGTRIMNLWTTAVSSNVLRFTVP